MKSEDERRKYVSGMGTRKKNLKNKTQHQRHITSYNNNFLK